jgi:2-polyprenyl-3-methyl-5-hydroxy-6-metoxy-1,4-benzoquinol methylase
LISEIGRSGARFRTVICRRCGLVFSDPKPHDVRDFYSKTYRLDYKGVTVPKLKHVYRAGRVALDRLARLSGSFVKGASLLDIGSGGGEFIYLMNCLGLKAVGVEPNTGYAEYSRAALDLDVRVGFAQDLDFPQQYFDLITIWHVLEHLEDPSDVLARLLPFLKPQGSLIIEVPNIKASGQAPANTFHVAHLYNFSQQTLTALLAKSGLAADLVMLSPDGGNLTITARRSPDGPCLQEAALDPGGAKAVEAFLTSRSAFGHFLSLKPYRRLMSRLGRALAEKKVLSGRSESDTVRREILDRLYRRAVESS